MEENKNVENEMIQKTEEKKGFSLNKDHLKKLTTPKALGVAVLLILLATGFYFKSSFVVASVNGGFISKASFVKELEKQSGKQVLENMVMEKLVKDELVKNNITISNEEVENEIKKIEEQVKGQGGTLEQVLVQQGLTHEELVTQITEQKKLEKLLANKVAVTDEEVQAAIKENKIEIPKGKEAETLQKIKEQLKQRKFQEEAQKWVSDLKTNAIIKYYKNY